VAECKSCKATITWAETVTGKAAPFEIDPTGTWAIVDGRARSAIPGDAPLDKSHFGACKQASSWRRKK